MKTNKMRHFLSRWRSDYNYKTFLSSTASFVITLLFAVYNGWLGVSRSSVWHGSVCVYYILLVLVRGGLLLTERQAYTLTEMQARDIRSRGALGTSWVLLIINLALVVPISLMVTLQRPVDMGIIPAIAMAAYTTYKVILASVHLKQRKRRGNILTRELRVINFIDALVSCLSLQNTLIVVNTQGQESRSMLTLTAVTSAAFLLVILFLSGRTLYAAVRERRAVKTQQPE